MAIKVGDKIPSVKLKTMTKDGMKEMTTDELFGKGKTVMFALPGAFTPTCSAKHLPGFVGKAEDIRKKGFDKIACLSVNDAFVMNEWAGNQGADNIQFLPDGNGEFTAAMGQLVDKADLGFGKRSWRYSMLVRNGVVEKMFVEPNKPGDPFEVSDAATMLAYINPKARKPDQVAILTRDGCQYCAQAKALLNERNIDYVEIPLAHKVRNKALGAIAGAQSVPQVFINGQRIGGYEELKRWAARAA